MRRLSFFILSISILSAGFAFAQTQMIITFKDGRTQSIDINTILRIEHQAAAPTSLNSPNANTASAQNAEFYFQQGQALFDKGHYAEAIKAYTKAIELNPNHDEAYRRRGVCKANLKNYEAAIPDFTRAIEINPKNSRAYNGRGNSKNKGLKDYAGAMSDFTMAIELDPTYSAAYYNRGNLKADMKDFTGAGNDCEASIAVNRKYSPGYICLGSINYELKDFHNAIQLFTTAIELDPRSEWAYYGRGRSYKDIGDTANASKDFQKTLEINPAHKNAQEGLNQLAFMQSEPPATKEYSILPEQKTAQPVQPKPVKAEPKPQPDAVPLELKQPLDIRKLTASMYNGTVRAAMEAMRLVYGNMTPQETKEFEAKWEPLFDSQTAEAVEYFNKLNPLLMEFLSLRAAIFQSAEEFEASWYEAMVAAGYESEGGVKEAMAIAEQQKTMLQSMNARLAQIVKTIEALGTPPLEAKNRAKKKHDGTVQNVKKLVKQPVEEKYWKPKTVIDEKCEQAFELGRTASMKIITRKNRAGETEYVPEYTIINESFPREHKCPSMQHRHRDLDVPGSSLAGVFRKGYECQSIKDPQICPSGTVDTGKDSDVATEEIADTNEVAEQKAKQEAIEFHGANIKIIERNLAKDAEELSKEKDASRRASLEFRILTAKAEIQAEKDLIASLQTGQIVHTRTEWDDYAKDKFIAGIKENQIKMEKAQQQLAEAQRIAALLPTEEAEKARAFIAEHLSPDVIAKADMGKIQQVTDAIFKKAEGYYQQAEAQKEIASAERALMVFEGVRTAGGIATSVVLGQTAASVYMGVTGYISGGHKDAVRSAASWYSTAGYMAVEVFDGYQKGGYLTKAGVAGAIEKGATAFGLGKLFEYGVKKMGSIITAPAKRKQELTAKLKDFRQKEALKTEQEFMKSLPQFKNELEEGKKLAKEFEQLNWKLAQAKAGSLPKGEIDKLEKAVLDKISSVNESFHAKKYLKYQGSPFAQKAAVYQTNKVNKLVDEEFHQMMKAEGFDMNKLEFKEFRNATSKGSMGIDRDFGVVDKGSFWKAAVNKEGRPILDKAGKPVMVRNNWIMKNGKPISLNELQNDGSKIYRRAYEKVTGKNADKSFQTFTTKAHSESFVDKNVLNDLRDPNNVAQLERCWGEQAGHTMQFKGLEMLHSPHLSKISGYQEAGRGLSKEIEKKLIPFLQNAKPGKGMDSKKLKETIEHFKDIKKVLDDFSVDKIDPITASRKIRELSGGKDLPEILDQMRNLTEAAFKFGGIGK